MRRPFVMTTGALALALFSSTVFAQTPPAGQTPSQPPAGQTPAQPSTPQKPTEPKLGFTAPGGILLVQVKKDQTTVFEEMATKYKTAMPNAKVYKSAEGMQGNELYVIVLDPAKPGMEYNPIDVLFNTMTDEQKRAPETQEMFKRYAAAFAGINKLNVTPVGGGM